MKRINLIAGLTVAVTVSLLNPVMVYAGPGKGKKEKHTKHVKVKKHSPPPFAPAHGYKHVQESGVELTYDTNLGAYLVVGKPDVYYQNGLFVSLTDGVWKVTANLNGEWRSHQEGEIPLKLWEAKKPKKAVLNTHGNMKPKKSKGKKK